MIRIALICDIHFGIEARSEEYALPNQNINGEIKNAVSMTEGAIKILNDNMVDYLFLAGDLTSRGKPVEFYYCNKKVSEIIEGANIEKDHVIWCSGNHDNDWDLAALGEAYSGQGELYNIAKKGYEDFAINIADSYVDHGHITKGSLPSSGIYEDDNMVVFVLNSSSECVRKETIEHGRLTESHLKWFEKKASEYKEAKKWKIVIMHHHPFLYAYPCPGLDVSQLEEGSEFCDIVGKNGIDLVLHGHRHHPRCMTRKESDWCKAVSFVCGGSFSVGEQQRLKGDIPNTFHVLELSDTVGLLKMYSYEYCPSNGWTEVSCYRDMAPVDKVMYLGKVYDEEQTLEAFSKLIQTTNGTEIYEWDELDDSIKYKSSKVLKEIIEKISSSECTIKMNPLDSIVVKK